MFKTSTFTKNLTNSKIKQSIKLNTPARKRYKKIF